MASISANGSKGHHKFTLEVTQGAQDIANNKTTVSYALKLSPIQTSWAWALWGSQLTYSITINGTTYSGNLPDYDGYATVTIKSGTQSVSHSADGTKSIAYSFSITDTTGQTYTSGNAGASGTLALTTIPRATPPVLSATSLTMGNPITITISPAVYSFTHKIRYSFGSLTEQTKGFDQGLETGYMTAPGPHTIKLTPPTSLGSQIPSANSGTCTITLYTYNSAGTHIGTKTATFTLSVPNYTPSVSISISGNSLLGGEYVQGKSAVKGNITASSQYGASISSISSVVDGKTYTGNPFTSEVLSSGNKSVVVTVKDSRGKTASATSAQFAVREYATPYITSVSAARQADGTTVVVALKGGVSSINGKNQVIYGVTLNGVTNRYTHPSSLPIDTTITFKDVPTDKTLEVKAEIKDSYNTATKTATLPTVAVTMDFLHDGKGIAMGKVAEKSELLDVAWPVKASGFKSQRGTRPTSANIEPEEKYFGSMEHYLASSAMKTGKPSLVDGYESSPDGYILHFHWDNDLGYDAQMYLRNKNGSLLTRGCNNGTWSAWKQFIDNSMCQDYVIEKGTSGIWSYRKWNSGILECWCSYTHHIAITKKWEVMYYSDELTPRLNYPFTFKSRPVETVSFKGQSVAGWLYCEGGGVSLNTETQTGQYGVCRPTSIAASNLIFDFYVKGVI